MSAIKIKEKSYAIFVLFGAILWFFTIFLRENSLSSDLYYNLFLGIAPNFAVVFLVFGLGMLYHEPIINNIKHLINNWHIYDKLHKHINNWNVYDKLYPYLLLTFIWILLILSEFVHEIFLNSPFDIFDIIASLLGTIIILLIYYYKK